MIRQYTEDDLSAITDLVECFATESGCFEIVGGFSRSHFLEILQSLTSFLRIWMVEKDGLIVSALAMIEQPNIYSGKKSLEELFWFSRPDYRGNLENIKLLQIAEVYAKNNGIMYVAMGNMVDFQPPKIENFYKKRGFKLHQKHYFRYLG